MLFSELHSAYYNAVAAILTHALDHPLEDRELWDIVRQHAFEESNLTIPSALKEERWQLLRTDGTTPLQHTPTMPLTTLEKRWLKAISLDPRIQLFGPEFPGLEAVEPLFRLEDVYVFDRYSDGDPYEDPTYIQNFRLILDALRNNYPLKVVARNRRGKPRYQVVLPEYLEYSEKDDKFRLIGTGIYTGCTINLSRIIRCSKSNRAFDWSQGTKTKACPQSVTLELVDQRNALERVMLHFAHFRKEAERLEKDRYRITVFYDKDDETELVIRILSFGPMLQVVAPEGFVGLIRQRLLDQKSCGL